MRRVADRRRLITAAGAALAALAAVALVLWGLAPILGSDDDTTTSRSATRAAAPQTHRSASPTPSPTATRSPAPTLSGSPVPPPTGKAAPAFGRSTTEPRGKPSRVVVVSTSGTTLVDAALVPSHLDDDGVLAPPFGVAGWYAEPGWAKPGWPGASILAGHINRRSPRLELDTFGHLTRVRAGDRITVAYTSGESVTFTATKSRAVSKKAVPRDDSIWDSGNPQPVLRLITCDPETPVKGGHYEGNWVVWASLA